MATGNYCLASCLFSISKAVLVVGRGCPQVWTPLLDHLHYEVSVCVCAHALHQAFGQGVEKCKGEEMGQGEEMVGGD